MGLTLAFSWGVAVLAMLAFASPGRPAKNDRHSCYNCLLNDESTLGGDFESSCSDSLRGRAIQPAYTFRRHPERRRNLRVRHDSSLLPKPIGFPGAELGSE